MEGEVVSVDRCIPAGPAAIFALVADAARHPEIDGSGTVRHAKSGTPNKLSLGATFGMSMKVGISYSMVSTVIEYEEDRRIAWQSRPNGFVGKLTGGRIWRYELEPAEGGTLVRESWDISQDHQRSLLRHGPMAKQTAQSMTKTLEKIEEIVTSE